MNNPKKDPAAVSLGRKGGLKGGQSKSPKKLNAVRANIAKARVAKAEKSKRKPGQEGES